jgi:hypothetical protein
MWMGNALPNLEAVAPRQIRLIDDDPWEAFWFLDYGMRDDPNCIRCPTNTPSCAPSPATRRRSGQASGQAA